MTEQEKQEEIKDLKALLPRNAHIYIRVLGNDQYKLFVIYKDRLRSFSGHLGVLIDGVRWVATKTIYSEFDAASIIHKIAMFLYEDRWAFTYEYI